MSFLKQSMRDVNGVRTEIVLQPFADKTLVLITQLGKVGNLVQVTMPQTAPLLPAPLPDLTKPNALLLPPPPPSIQLVPLLGNAPTEHLRVLHALYASQIATIIWVSETEGLMDNNRRSVVVGLALRKSDITDNEHLTEAERENFNGIMGMVTELIS